MAVKFKSFDVKFAYYSRKINKFGKLTINKNSFVHAWIAWASAAPPPPWTFLHGTDMRYSR